MKKLAEAIKQIEALKKHNVGIRDFHLKKGSVAQYNMALSATCQNDKALKILKTIKEKDDE